MVPRSPFGDEGWAWPDGPHGGHGGDSLGACVEAGRWFVWPLSVAGGAGLAAMWAGMGLPVWRTGPAGEPVGLDDWMIARSQGLITIMVTPALALLAWFHGGRSVITPRRRGGSFGTCGEACEVLQPLLHAP